MKKNPYPTTYAEVNVSFDADGTLTREAYDEILNACRVEGAHYPSAWANEICDIFEARHAAGESLIYEHHIGGWEPDYILTGVEV